MKKFTFIPILFLSLFLVTSCIEDKPTIMIVGDSWGQIMCGFKTFDDALEDNGFENHRTECALTTVSGSKASDWKSGSKAQRVRRNLRTFPQVTVVVLSVSGNDFLGDWHKDMTHQEEEAILDEIEDDVRQIVENILGQREDINIVMGSYDYPNFDLLPPGDILRSYRKLYEGMGEPTTEELNAALIRLSERMDSLFNEYPRAEFVSTMGLMQHTFGQPDFDIAPGELEAPSEELFIGGDPLIGSPRESLLNIDNTTVVDPYHLNKSGFSVFAQRLMEAHINEWVENSPY